MANKGRITLRDVAAEAGVSVTTASFVLNDQNYAIAERTQLRVREVASRLGYRPHSSARALATGRTQRLGVVLSSPGVLVSPGAYHAKLLFGIMAAAPKLNYNLILHAANYPDWRCLYGDITSGVADGVMLIGRNFDDELTAALLDIHFPTVCVSYKSQHPSCIAVDCDHRSGIALAVDHLKKLGHTRLGFLLDDYSDVRSWDEERLAAFHSCTEGTGLKGSTYRVPVDYGDCPGSNEFLRSLLLNSRTETALIVGSEVLARHVQQVALECGVNIPLDLSIISINSTEVSENAVVPITSLWQPLNEIGAAAVTVLNDIIMSDGRSEHQMLFDMRLDIRKSCGPALVRR